MLLNNLYTIQKLAESENQIQVTVKLKADHDIFEGHFPGQPVLPGVCMMEMIAEITGYHLQKSFRISGSPLIKFLRMIDPKKNPLVHFEIKFQPDKEIIFTKGMIFLDKDIFMKFQLTLVPEASS